MTARKPNKKKGEIVRRRPLIGILDCRDTTENPLTPELFQAQCGDYSPMDHEPDSHARVRTLVDNNLLDFGLIQERLQEFIGCRKPWLGEKIYLNEKLGCQEIKYEGTYQGLENCLLSVGYGLSSKTASISDVLLLEVFRLGLLVGEVNNKDAVIGACIVTKRRSNNPRIWPTIMLNWLTEGISNEELKPYKGSYILSGGNGTYANENAKAAMAHARRHCPGDNCPVVFSDEGRSAVWIKKNLKAAITRRLEIEK